MGSSSTPARQEAFLEAFRLCGKIAQSCKKARIHRETYRQWRLKDKAFVKRMEETKTDLVELLEDSYVTKALRADGEKANWNLLKSLAPEKYRETSDLNLKSPVPLEITLSDDRGEDAPPP